MKAGTYIVSPVSSAYQPTPCENSGAQSIIRPEILALAAERVASAPRISPADAAPLLAMFAGARAACDAATARFAGRETGRAPVDHQALKRRREASLRLPPLADGHRDPMLGLIGRTA
jgi:hypothetical protein